jgi:hypothetical protein
MLAEVPSRLTRVESDINHIRIALAHRNSSRGLRRHLRTDLEEPSLIHERDARARHCLSMSASLNENRPGITVDLTQVFADVPQRLARVEARRQKRCGLRGLKAAADPA